MPFDRDEVEREIVLDVQALRVGYAGGVRGAARRLAARCARVP